ncbi:MAG: UDP-N-acetylglucosamine 1-carboxyvinyltransferase [Alphaproteobacteria bacterium]|nr:UDP-N-acetylglucosamine 1-carboxyvinyltransferase [Alphaproteobacteria bacterium]
MQKMVIKGGNELNGRIRISGAKNAALKHMVACLLTDEPVNLENCPVNLGDIKMQAAVLKTLGAEVVLREDGMAMIHAKAIESHVAPYDLVRKMRASVLILGPLLARYGKAEVSLPGGCAIGTRPIDMHLDALSLMGAEIKLDGGYVKAEAPNGLKGAEINFSKVSVGATENIMMAATLAKGVTIINNAAREPEIVDQGEALIKMGAKIEGLGTARIVIEGVEKLHGVTHEIVPDRIEAGTYMIAVAMTGGKVVLENVRPEHLITLIGPLKEAGMHIEQDGKDLIVERNGVDLKGFDIMTEPHPGFPTDLQAQLMSLMTICKGAGMITETIFENRFMHVPELIRMGAEITVHGNSALVRGVSGLKGAEVMATDLRASVALVLAGLVAEGETVVNRIYHLNRGYEKLVEKLSACGADIRLA